MATGDSDSMDLSDSGGNTFRVTPGVPQCHRLPSSLSSLFIRDCYPTFYRMLIELLNTPATYFTLTGTPDIGKSVFYLYFFGRFKQDFPKARIVLASFYDGRIFKECKVWNPNTMSLEPSNDIPTGNALHLYDGVPLKLPGSDCKMICFTSPNQTWLQSMTKFTEYHRTRYMPNWSLMEQLRARDALGINLNDATIKTRWNYFGGTVRYTFSDSETVTAGVSLVQDALDGLTTAE